MEQFSSRHDNDIEAGRNFVTAKILPDQSFSTISLDRATQFFRRRDPQAPNLLTVGQNEDRAVAAVNSGAFFVDVLELGTPANPFILTQAGRRLVRSGGHGFPSRRAAGHRPLLAADRQALASFGPATFQHQSSVLRAHSHQKSVRLSAPSRVRLKRTLSLTHGIPRRTNAKIRFGYYLVCSTRPSGRQARRRRKCAWMFHRSRARTVNGSEAVPKVSISAALCYSRRPSQFLCPQSFACVFGLFPKFSTPVEKTVENRQV